MPVSWAIRLYLFRSCRHRRRLLRLSAPHGTLDIHSVHVRHEEKEKMRKFSKEPDAMARLSPEQYRVTQENGTEAPGTGEYLDNKQPGIYVDIVSGEPLFASSDKFESGCGWPSFTKPIEPANVNELRDDHARHGTHRGALGARRQPSRARVSRRSEGPRRIALLHQLGLPAVRPSGRYGSRGLWGLLEPSGGCPMTRGTRRSCRRLLLGRTGSYSPPRRRSVDTGRLHRRQRVSRHVSQSRLTCRSSRDHL